MNNKKGFTVVELVATFALTMVIVVFLFQILIDVKDIFVETSIKTNLQEKLGIISKNIKHNMPAPNVKVDKYTVTVGGQAFKMPDDVTINVKDIVKVQILMPTINVNDSSIKDECLTPNECYLKVNLKLQSPNLSKDYEYSVVYYYTTN